MWQEIEPLRYKNAVLEEADKAHWHNVNMNTETPISLKKKYWNVLYSGVVQTHKGRKRVTPNRYISYVVAEQIGTGNVVVFTNSHFVSGAFSNKYPFTKKWRRARWDYHWSIMHDMVNKFVNAGYTVIGGGDWNATHVRKFMRRQRWLATGGIDHLFTCEATNGTQVKLIETSKETHVYTDHDFRIAHARFRKAKAYEQPGPLPKFSYKSLAK